MTAPSHSERRLAVLMCWGTLGSFGLASVLSGFADGHILLGLLGFLLVAAGFVAHLIVNHVFHTGFTTGEIALGLLLFAVSLLGFALSWIFDPLFGRESIIIGLSGFSGLAIGWVSYILISYGIRGSIQMIESLRHP